MKDKKREPLLSYEQIVRAVQGDAAAISAVLQLLEEDFQSRAQRPTMTRWGKTIWQEDLELKGRMISRVLRAIPNFDYSIVKENSYNRGGKHLI